MAALRNIFDHLKANLFKVGFTQSFTDPCFFISDQVICLVYVDGTLFYSPNKQGMNLNVADDVAGFLVIKRLDNNKIA